MSEDYRAAIARALDFPNTPRTLDDAVAAVLAVRDVEMAAKVAETERLRAEVRDLRNTYEVRHPEDEWRVVVGVPLHLDGDLQSSLFRAVSKAVDGWQPEDRDGWDAFVSGYPYSHSEEAERDRLRAELAAKDAQIARAVEFAQAQAAAERESHDALHIGVAKALGISPGSTVGDIERSIKGLIEGVNADVAKARAGIETLWAAGREVREALGAGEFEVTVDAAKRVVAELAAKDDRIAVLQRAWDRAREATAAWLDGRVVVLPEEWRGAVTNAVYFNYGPEPKLIDQLCELIESWRPATEAAEAPDQAETTRRWRDSEGHVWGELEPGLLTGRDMVNVPEVDVAQGYGPLTEIPQRAAKPYESCVLDSSGHCSRGSHTHDTPPDLRVAKEGCEATAWDRCLLKECDCGGYTAEPRVFRKGDPEPSDINQVKDDGDRRWCRNRADRFWYLRDIAGPFLMWDELLDRVELVTEVPTEGGKA